MRQMSEAHFAVLRRHMLEVIAIHVELTDEELGNTALDPRVQWQQLEGGRFPAAPGEALADVNRAKSSGLALGDVVRIGSGAAAVDVEVVGLVDSPAALGASLYVPWDDLRRLEDTL